MGLGNRAEMAAVKGIEGRAGREEAEIGAGADDEAGGDSANLDEDGLGHGASFAGEPALQSC